MQNTDDINSDPHTLARQLFRNTDMEKTEWLCTDFLLGFANPSPKAATNNIDNRLVPLERLWHEMRAIGMKHPLELRICLSTQTVRLETGNQRIRLFKANRVARIPTRIHIASTPIGNLGNGAQLYPLKDTHFDFEALDSLEEGFHHPKGLILTFVERR